jgi:intracellular sulfur oxidation DsrE/DsrF family protein
MFFANVLIGDTWMIRNLRRFCVLMLLGIVLSGVHAFWNMHPLWNLQASAAAPPAVSRHHVVFQINNNDEGAMKHAISNSVNLIEAYRQRNEGVDIEIVAYGAGIHMFRADTSPVKDVLKFIQANNPNIAFTACGNTQKIMEKNEGHPITFIDGVKVTPAYIRP